MALIYFDSAVSFSPTISTLFRRASVLRSRPPGRMLLAAEHDDAMGFAYGIHAVLRRRRPMRALATFLHTCLIRLPLRHY